MYYTFFYIKIMLTYSLPLLESRIIYQIPNEHYAILLALHLCNWPLFLIYHFCCMENIFQLYKIFNCFYLEKAWLVLLQETLFTSAMEFLSFQLVVSATQDLCCFSWSLLLRRTFVALVGHLRYGTFVISVGCLYYIELLLLQLVAFAIQDLCRFSWSLLLWDFCHFSWSLLLWDLYCLSQLSLL